MAGFMSWQFDILSSVKIFTYNWIMFHKHLIFCAWQVCLLLTSEVQHCSEFIVCNPVKTYDWLNMAVTFWFWHNLAMGNRHVFASQRLPVLWNAWISIVQLWMEVNNHNAQRRHYISQIYEGGKATLCSLHNRLLSSLPVRLTNGRMRSYSAAADGEEMRQGWRD